MSEFWGVLIGIWLAFCAWCLIPSLLWELRRLTREGGDQ